MLLKNALVHTMAHDYMNPVKLDVLVENGKIIRLAEKITDDYDGKMLDLSGCHLLPGLIDSHTHIGLQSIENPQMLGDITEMTHPVTPSMRVIYSVDVTNKAFKHGQKNGITTVGIIPGSGNVVNGIGFATKTYGDNIYDMCIRESICLKIALGSNPKGLYGGKNMEPSSRMGVIFLFRELLHNAKAYMDKKEKGEIIDKNEQFEAVIPVFKKEIPLRIHCTHNDMATACEVAKEFDLNFTIEHAWGSDHYPDEIIESGCGIVYGPIGGKRTHFESRRTDIGTVAMLDRKGVLVTLTTDSPILGLDSLIHMAEEAVRQGTPVGRVLRMITLNAAKILGVESRVGSIEPGKDADFSVFKGLPCYDMSAHVLHTIVDGNIIYSK